MPSNVTHRFVSPILWKLNQPLYSSAIQHVFAVAVVYTHRSVPPIWLLNYYLLYNLKRGYCVVGDIVILIFI